MRRYQRSHAIAIHSIVHQLHPEGHRRSHELISLAECDVLSKLWTQFRLPEGKLEVPRPGMRCTMKIRHFTLRGDSERSVHLSLTYGDVVPSAGRLLVLITVKIDAGCPYRFYRSLHVLLGGSDEIADQDINRVLLTTQVQWCSESVQESVSTFLERYGGSMHGVVIRSRCKEGIRRYDRPRGAIYQKDMSFIAQTWLQQREFTASAQFLRIEYRSVPEESRVYRGYHFHGMCTGHAFDLAQDMWSRVVGS